MIASAMAMIMATGSAMAGVKQASQGDAYYREGDR